MIVAINYANKKYYRAQKFNSLTAIHKGRVDKVISYSTKDIDEEFKQKNAHILSQKRGNGYWLWKPYVILKTLEQIEKDDYVVYLDSGAFYLNNVNYLIKEMEKDCQDIMSFEIPFKELWYTKRDAFIALGCDLEEYTQSNQRMATMIIIRKSAFSINFVKEWLLYAQKENVISDSKNILGKCNYREFRDHRHDQSIFSLLSKKYKLKAYRDPSQYGRFSGTLWEIPIHEYNIESSYPQIIAEHRKGCVDKKTYREQLLFAYAPKIIIQLYSKISNMDSKGRKKKIAVLTDNRPISEEHYGYGMYKVVHRLLMALNDCVDTIICTDSSINLKEVDITIHDKIRVRNKFKRYKDCNLGNLHFIMELFPEIVGLRKKGVSEIFIPLGANYHELQRAYIVATLFGMKVSVYVVDDFGEYQRNILNENYNVEEFNKKISKYLEAVKNIFVVSKGMQKHIYQIAKRKSTVLLIPYNYTPMKEVNPNLDKTIMFIGNISGLYIDGLCDIAEIIDEINEEYNLNIKLVFTYKTNNEVKRLIGNYKCIVSCRVGEEEILRKKMRDSLFCFMPYSLREKFSLMQDTSFPSKLIEYLSSAKSIVIYGNIHNSAADYFKENDLPYVINGRDKQLLKNCILEHLHSEINHSREYITVVEKNHSFKKIKKLVSKRMLREN